MAGIEQYPDKYQGCSQERIPIPVNKMIEWFHAVTEAEN
jgi:hypothetical protein